MSEGGEDECPSSSRASESTLLLPFCFFGVLKRLDDGHHTGEGNFFSWFTDSSVNFFCTYPHRYTLK
jgi:hypothetical protein